MAIRICARTDMEEALTLLYSMEENKNKAQKCAELEKRIGHSLSETSKQKLDFIYRVQAEVRESLSDYQRELDFYFGHRENDASFPAEILLLWTNYGTMEEYQSFAEWKKYLLEMDEEPLFTETGRMIFSYSQDIKDSLDMEICRNMEDLMKLILSIDIPAEDKIRLQDMVMNRKKHLERIEPLIDTALLFVRKYKTEIDGYQKAFETFWTHVLEKTTPFTYLKPVIGMAEDHELEANPFGHLVRLCVFNPVIMGYSITMDDKTGEYEAEDRVLFGLLYDETFSLLDYLSENSSMDKEEAVKILKLLSDSSKFEILCYTKNHPAYGAQIAEHLSLTTATISYHTNDLHKAGLVQIEKKGNKLYYSTKEETVQRLIEYLKMNLL